MCITQDLYKSALQNLRTARQQLALVTHSQIRLQGKERGYHPTNREIASQVAATVVA